MSGTREPIAVIGTGYVGLVTAAGFAEFGSEVWCVDVDQAKVDRLRRGEIPIYEPGLAESLERNSERLHFDTELAPALEHARLLFVACWLTSAVKPAHNGAAQLVPIVRYSTPPSAIVRISSAVKATSGVLRNAGDA